MKRVLDNLKLEQLAELCRRWRILELSIFGSRARGDFRSDSDVDLLVRFAPDAPWSAFDLVLLRDEFQQIFGQEVDLVEESAIKNPFRRHTILRDKEIIYAA